MDKTELTVTAPRALTTPSNLHRRKLCPGSAKMEAGFYDKDGTDARLGRFFHSYWAHPEYERALLTPEDRDLLERADMLNGDVLAVLNFSGTPALFVETTLTGVNGRLTGTPDRVYGWREHKAALVSDLKSGFAVVERAELNLQLRGYAVLVHENNQCSTPLERIFVSILQPRLWSPSERTTLAQYTPDDIRRAETEIDRIIDGTEQPDAPLRAGEEQCRFCRAKLVCPAFRAAVNLPLAGVQTEEDLSKLAREAEIQRRLKGCNDDQLEQIFLAVKLADTVHDDVFAECRQRIKDGGFANYVLGKESEARTVTNVRRAIALLALSNIASREEILDMCKVPLHTLEEHYRKRHKGVTWQQAKDKINRILANVTTREPREPKILPAKRRLKR